MKKMHLVAAFLVVLALAFPMLSFAGSLTLSAGGTNCGINGVCSNLQGTPNTETVNFNAPFTFPVVPTITLFGNAGLETGFMPGFSRNPDGDSTQYIAAGSTGAGGKITVTNLPGGATYFGLYWGSIDTFNSLIVTDSVGDKFTITGTTLHTAFGVNDNGTSSLYVNLNLSGATISSILLESSMLNFESDNWTFFSPQQSMPEPATLSVLGVGLFAFGAGLRRKLGGKAGA